jgi:hypothetical protein
VAECDGFIVLVTLPVRSRASPEASLAGAPTGSPLRWPDVAQTPTRRGREAGDVGDDRLGQVVWTGASVAGTGGSAWRNAQLVEEAVVDMASPSTVLVLVLRDEERPAARGRGGASRRANRGGLMS